MNKPLAIATRPAPACHVCGGPGAPVYTGLHDQAHGVPGSWTLVRCQDPSCGLGWLDPIPLESEIHKAYASYYTHAAWRPAPEPGPPGSSPRDLVLRAVFGAFDRLYRRHGVAEARALHARMFLDGIPPGRVLDVGTGNGCHMVWLAERGWQVEGQDVDPRAVQALREAYGYVVHEGPLEQLGLQQGAYDAVIAAHVLEHVHDPRAFLRTCLALLKPGGTLVMLMPNFAALGRQVYGERWAGLEPPRHLYHFNRRALARLAEQAGAERIETWTTSCNAEVMASNGWAARHGDRPSLARDLAARLFQLRALRHTASHPDEGEELVLRIRR